MNVIKKSHADSENDILSVSATVEESTPESRPDRRCLKMWKYAVLLAGFFNYVVVFGFLKGVGVFIVEWREYFDISTAKASTINIGIAFVLPFLSPLGGALSQRYGCRAVTIVGAAIGAVATFAASFSPNMTVLICLMCVSGFGLSLAFIPCTPIIGYYFNRHLALANGILSSGVGAGILVIPPLTQALCIAYGWRGALLIMSAIFANVCVCGMVFQPTRAERVNMERLWASQARSQAREKEDKTETETAGFLDQRTTPLHEVDQSLRERGRHCSNTFSGLFDKLRQVIHFLHLHLLWTNPQFGCFCAVSLFVSFGYYSSLVYLAPRAIYDLGISKQTASFILSTVGISSIFGRAAHGPLLDKKIISVFKLAPIALLFSSISSLLNPLAKNYLMLQLLAVIFGFGSGAFNAMCQMYVRELVPAEVVASGFGLYVMGTSFGNIIGAFTLGALYDATGSYVIPFFIAGSSTFIGMAMCVVLMCFSSRNNAAQNEMHVGCEKAALPETKESCSAQS